MIKLLKNKKILDNAIIGFASATIISLISTINFIYYINTLDNDLSTMITKDLAGLHIIQTARVDLQSVNSELKNLFIKNDNPDKNEIIININNYRNEYLKNIRQAKPLFTSQKGKNIFREVEKSNIKYLLILDQILAVYDNDRDNVLHLSRTGIQHEFDHLNQLLKKLSDIKKMHDIKFFNKFMRTHSIMLVSSVLILIITVLFRIIHFRHNRKKSRV